MKLRLLLWEACNRNCEGCCNKEWDLKELPVVENYRGYDCIMLTGGEPMLYPRTVLDTIQTIRKHTNKPIYMYTAKASEPYALFTVLNFLDGMTLTLHHQNDVRVFTRFNTLLLNSSIRNKSLRLNIFKDIGLGQIDTSLWKVRRDIEWIKDCPLPENEVFMRL